MALSEFPAAHSTDAVSHSAYPVVVQTTQTSTLSSLSSSSKKRSIPEEQDEPDSALESSDDLLVHKRARPNFLPDDEQTMLLAQLDVSQQTESSVEMTQADTLSLEEAKSPEKDTTSPSDFKTPAKTKKAAPNVSHMKSFFSPEPKELASKKMATKESEPTKKAAAARGAGKAKAETTPSTTQISIRDMMFQSTAKTQTVVVQPPAPRATTTTTTTWSVVATTGAQPGERWGHTATAIAENRVVVYGGADDDETTLGDLHVLDLATRAWSTPLNCESIPRTWHDAVHLATKHLLLVFGGERSTANDQLDVLSDIMVLDTQCFLWYPPAVSGTPPTARSGHACTVVGNDVVVFGGSRGRSRQSAVHVLDSDAWHWKQVKVEGKPPSARTYHSAVAVGGDSVVYFGGNDASTSFDSVHVLQKTKTTAKGDVWTWFHPCVVGRDRPCARTGHSATLVDERKILIFGGWDPQTGTGAPTVFNDAFLLDTTTWEWERVHMETALPGRVGHRAVLGHDGKTVLLVGGQDAKEQRLSVVHELSLSTSSSDTGGSDSGDSSVPATQAST
jgi:hypothetical protein